MFHNALDNSPTVVYAECSKTLQQIENSCVRFISDLVHQATVDLGYLRELQGCVSKLGLKCRAFIESIRQWTIQSQFNTSSRTRSGTVELLKR
jgi:hypothetical protein